MKKKLIDIVLGGRPNFIKVPLLISLLKKEKKIEFRIILTNQHYSFELKKVFLETFKKNNIKIITLSTKLKNSVLEISSSYSKVIKKRRPNLVIVFGDMNSSLAGAIAAYENKIKLGHVESGLRSFDKTMVEETNRILIDQISDFLWCTSLDACKNLKNENIKKNIFFVGNTMIDTLKFYKKKILDDQSFKNYGVKRKDYVMLTYHRDFNVDKKNKLLIFINELNKISKKFIIVFPIHPRTKKMLKKFNLLKNFSKRIILLNSLSYFNFISLVYNSLFVITDSGGIQEECAYLKKRCFTIRPNTERPVTILCGSNILVNQEKFSDKIFSYLIKKKLKINKIKYWDGLASSRILNTIKKNLKFLN